MFSPGCIYALQNHTSKKALEQSKHSHLLDIVGAFVINGKLETAILICGIFFITYTTYRKNKHVKCEPEKQFSSKSVKLKSSEPTVNIL